MSGIVGRKDVCGGRCNYLFCCCGGRCRVKAVDGGLIIRAAAERRTECLKREEFF